MERHIEPRRAATAIDNRRGADDLRPRRLRNLHGLSRGAARRQHVLDDEDAIAPTEREPPAQHKYAILPFGENRAHAEPTADFLADDDAAKRRRKHHVGPQIARPVADGTPQRFSVPRMLQYERRLQVARTVESGREAEMPIE